jgi:hypothetical protein
MFELLVFLIWASLSLPFAIGMGRWLKELAPENINQPKPEGELLLRSSEEDFVNWIDADRQNPAGVPPVRGLILWRM